MAAIGSGWSNNGHGFGPAGPSRSFTPASRYQSLRRRSAVGISVRAPSYFARSAPSGYSAKALQAAPMTARFADLRSRPLRFRFWYRQRCGSSSLLDRTISTTYSSVADSDGWSGRESRRRVRSACVPSGSRRPELADPRNRSHPQTVPVGAVQVPAVPAPLFTQRAGVWQPGPSTVSQGDPSVASPLQVPMSPLPVGPVAV